MKSLIRIVAVAACWLAWRAECQNQAGEGSGLYVSPAYSGDFGGTYVSPAFGGGSSGGGPGTAEAPGTGGPGGRGLQGRPNYEFQNFGAYSSPAFSGPELGILVTPPRVQQAKPKSNADKPNPLGDSAPVKPSGVAEKQADSETSTNRLEKPTAPPSTSTNAPAGQGGTGPL